MKNITQTRNLLFSGLSMVILLGVFSSCSSSKNTHYSDDGIYGTTPSQPQEEVVMVRDTRSDYYQNYFSGEKEIHEEIFTDVDSYQGYQDTDTVYVDEQYAGGYPPWEYSNSNVSVNFSVGFGGGWGYGWGYPCYGWGWGWSGYGWGYPCGGWGYGWGWGYPGYGWGYPGWGWGPGWGYYPPYYGHYTYGKRYAHNTSRLNTRGVYNERTLSSRYNRSSSNYDRRLASNNYSRGRYPNSARNLDRSYQRSTRNRSGSNYNRSTNRGYNSRSYNRSAPGSRSYRGTRSSSGMSRGGMSRGGMSRGGMSRSSGRRNMSYIDLDNSSYGSNRTFVKRNTGVKSVATNNNRISYSAARSNPNYQRTIRTNPAVSRGNSGSYRGGTYGNVRSSSARSSSGRSNSSSRSGSYSRSSSRSSSGSSFRSSGGGSRSSGTSRSGGSGRSSSRNR